MTVEKTPHEFIQDLVAQRAERTDSEILSEIEQLPTLADEDDVIWDDLRYWREHAYRYLALADVAAERKLRAAVPLLLERACHGDPGETMRGLRHKFERTFAPDWRALAEVCMQAYDSVRPGARLWATSQLMTLDDPLARPLFQRALSDPIEDVRDLAAAGLKRLDRMS